MALGSDEPQSSHSIYPSPFCTNLCPNLHRKGGDSLGLDESNWQLRTIWLKWQYVLPSGLPVVPSLNGSLPEVKVNLEGDQEGIVVFAIKPGGVATDS